MNIARWIQRRRAEESERIALDRATELSSEEMDVIADDAFTALDLVLRFHAGGPWTETDWFAWKVITGSDEATTKVMCDHIRSVLARLHGRTETTELSDEECEKIADEEAEIEAEWAEDQRDDDLDDALHGRTL